jgi:Na+/H+ antiporter NhaA
LNEYPARATAWPVVEPLQEFLRLEAAGGVLLMIAAVVAMGVANSAPAPRYERLLQYRPWINDGLMLVPAVN